MENYVVVILIGYFLGCFQSSFIFGKFLKGVDIRNLGNGNAGASNSVNTLGWKFGILVGLSDIFKAIISLLIVQAIFKDSITTDKLSFFSFLNGFFVILGHNYPFYMKFKGGKGTASLIGLLIALDFRMAILCILTIVIVTIVTNYIALGTIGLLVVMIVCTILFGYSKGSIVIAILISLLSLYKHLPNMKNIMAGTEVKLISVLKK